MIVDDREGATRQIRAALDLAGWPESDIFAHL